MKKIAIQSLFLGGGLLGVFILGRCSVDTSYWKNRLDDKEFVSATAICYALGENQVFFNQNDQELIFTTQQKDPRNSEKIIMKTVIGRKGRKNYEVLEYYEIDMGVLPHVLKKEEVLLLNATEVRKRLEKIGPTIYFCCCVFVETLKEGATAKAWEKRRVGGLVPDGRRDGFSAHQGSSGTCREF